MCLGALDETFPTFAAGNQQLGAALREVHRVWAIAISQYATGKFFSWSHPCDLLPMGDKELPTNFEGVQNLSLMELSLNLYCCIWQLCTAVYIKGYQLLCTDQTNKPTQRAAVTRGSLPHSLF